MPSDTATVQWHTRDRRFPAFARVLAAINANRDRLLWHFPMVPVGGFGIGIYCNIGPLPVGLLVTCWQKAPQFSAPCPSCAEPALGLHLGCTQRSNPIYGICTKCGLSVHKSLDVGSAPTSALALIRKMAEWCGTSLAKDGRILPVPGATPHDWRPIVAVLGEIGVDGLPKTLRCGRLSGSPRPRRPYA